ncbi:multiple epidermal growth factor-like domains protein 9 isoform X1, partial [Tachysurus ichikawai]
PQCNCSTVGSVGPDSCDPLTGGCTCLLGYSGLGCEQCYSGYFRNRTGGCQPCDCDSSGAVGPQCNGVRLKLALLCCAGTSVSNYSLEAADRLQKETTVSLASASHYCLDWRWHKAHSCLGLSPGIGSDRLCFILTEHRKKHSSRN